MRILVLQHERVEHAGIYRDKLRADGHEWQAVMLDEGEALPNLDGFDALWVLGGPMQVWEEDAHPWLVAEKALIRQAVAERGLPYLGICLGHQLLADALGGQVGLAARPEIGVLGVDLTQAGQADPVLSRLGPRFEMVQWHSAEVARPPAGAQVLARSPDCTVQAMRCGPRAISVQFHPEVDVSTLDDWNANGGLDRAAGAETVTHLRNACDHASPRMQAAAGRLYDGWMRATGR